MVGTEAELRDLIGSPSHLVQAKVADRLNDLSAQWIARSPFVCVATCSPEGGLDVSPRGDPAGFVRVLDESTLLIPERPGNRLADTLTNVLADGRIALLFLVPGIGDTFRVNGRARLVDDPALLEPCAIDGKVPKLGILVDVQQAYTQCPKALLRSELWNPARHADPSELPKASEILKAVGAPDLNVAEYEVARAERYRRREGFY